MVKYDDYDRPVLFQPVTSGEVIAAAQQIWSRVTYSAVGEVIRVDYVGHNGRVVNGAQGYASVIIEQLPDGSTTNTMYSDAKGIILDVKKLTSEERKQYKNPDTSLGAGAVHRFQQNLPKAGLVRR